MKWQTMNTAPMDGTEVIVCLRERDFLRVLASFYNHVGGWQRGSWTHMTPIYWMPYPEPPKVGHDGGGSCCMCEMCVEIRNRK